MKKLSFWAKRNPQRARLVIVGGRIALALIGFFYGLVLASFDRFAFHPLAWCSVFLFLMAFFFYPRRNDHSTYRRRKIADGVLVFSTLLFYATLGNWLAQPASLPAGRPLQPPPGTAWSSLERAPAWHGFTKRDQWLKKTRKEVRHAVQEIRAARKSLDPDTVAALTLLSVLLAVGLGIILASLACRALCSGQENAALLIVLLGSLVIALLIAGIWRLALSSARHEAAGHS